MNLTMPRKTSSPFYEYGVIMSTRTPYGHAPWRRTWVQQGRTRRKAEKAKRSKDNLAGMNRHVIWTMTLVDTGAKSYPGLGPGLTGMIAAALPLRWILAHPASSPPKWQPCPCVMSTHPPSAPFLLQILEPAFGFPTPPFSTTP